MDDTPDKYASSRALFPGLIGQAQMHERRWMIAAAIACAYAGAAEWRHSMQLARAKVEAGAPRVLQANCDGSVTEARLASADEYRLADGLVFERLDRVVRCMRGLEGDAARVRECWETITPLFRGDAAKRFGVEASKLLGKTREEFARKVESEHVAVERLPGQNKTVAGGYVLRWREVGRRGGKTLDESWSGVFTVRLVPVTDESGGLVIDDYTWEQEQP